MKILGGIVLLVLTFTLGTQTAVFLSWSTPEISGIVVAENTTLLKDERATTPKGIRVMYAGTEPARDDEIAYLRFVVYNGTGNKLVYGSKGAEWPPLRLWVNARLLSHEYCASGASRYYIEPNGSAEFRVGVYEFEKAPQKNDKINVAFYLAEDGSDSAEEILSAPFVILDSFRQEIDLWNKKQNERWR
jgi:hypothetical protein